MGRLGFDKVVELVKQRLILLPNLKTFIDKKCKCLKNKKPNRTEKHI